MVSCKHQCREWTFTCYHSLGLLFKGGGTRKTHWMEPFRSPEDGWWGGGRCQSVPCPSVRAHRTLEGNKLWEHLDWGLPLCLSTAVAHFFPDQRHVKHAPIFYKFRTQLEDQKVGERQTAREMKLNPDSQVHSPDSSPPHQDFSLFLPFFLFLFFLAFCFLSRASFLNFPWYLLSTGVAQEGMFVWMVWVRVCTICNFPLCGSALKSEVVRCTQRPRLPYLSPL